MGYSAFLRQNKRFLAFGFLLAALSSYGQSFFIGLFEAPIRDAFGLSKSGYAFIYTLATVVSGFSIMWLGRGLDRRDLRPVTTAILLGASAGAILLASAVNTVVLGLALVLLRLCGQGLLMHTAQTAMGRYFGVNRGKAVSVATMGLPGAEAILPVATVGLMALLGWRGTWLAMAALLLVLGLPLALFLLRGHDQRQRDLASSAAPAWSEHGGRAGGQWQRREVVRDARFYALLPAVMSPAFIMTALFVLQGSVADGKGWSPSWLAGGITVFAISHIIALILAGPLVDRLGVRRLVAGFLGPITLALLVLVFMESRWGAPLTLGLAGLSMGSAGTLMGALWPSLYGTQHLGAIRALVHAIMVMVTACAPLSFGVVMDAGVAITTIAAVLAAWNVAATALAVAALWRSPTV